MIVWTIVVRISIYDDCESTEKVFATENCARNHSVPSVPKGKAITEKIFAYRRKMY